MRASCHALCPTKLAYPSMMLEWSMSILLGRHIDSTVAKIHIPDLQYARDRRHIPFRTKSWSPCMNVYAATGMDQQLMSRARKIRPGLDAAAVCRSI